jgi:hypothetical protein
MVGTIAGTGVAPVSRGQGDGDARDRALLAGALGDRYRSRMEMQLVNERHASRRAVEIVCQVVRERDFALLAERGADLSPDGMFVPFAVGAVVGDGLVVSLRVPGTQRWIDTLAVVARVVRGKRLSDIGPGFGIRFTSIDPESSRHLRWALCRYPPTFPARAPRIDYAATGAMIALS